MPNITLNTPGLDVPQTLEVEQARVIEAVSPTAEVERVTGGAEITVTDYRGSTTATVYDGEQGPQGETGPAGQDGAPGPGVAAGGTTGQVLKKASNDDYDTEWSDGDFDAYATKTDTVLDTTLSRGRAAGTTVGEGSFAFGNGVEASGANSFATGDHAVAKGDASFARGFYARTIGNSSTAEGTYVSAVGDYAHASGGASSKSIKFTGGANSVIYTVSAFIPVGSIVFTSYSQNGLAVVLEIEQINGSWQATLDNTLDAENPITNARKNVFIGAAVGHYSHTEGSNSIALGDIQHVEGRNNEPNGDYVHIVGNGFTSTQRSNAYALDWDGNGHYMGDVYVGCNEDSTGGEKLITASEAPVTDVQVNGNSVVDEYDGVARVSVPVSYNTAENCSEPITDAAGDQPMGVKITLPLQQDGTGDPAPDNIRQYTPYISVNINVSDGDEQGNSVSIEFPRPFYAGTVEVFPDKDYAIVTHGIHVTSMDGASVEESGDWKTYTVRHPLTQTLYGGYTGSSFATHDDNDDPTIAYYHVTKASTDVYSAHVPKTCEADYEELQIAEELDTEGYYREYDSIDGITPPKSYKGTTIVVAFGYTESDTVRIDTADVTYAIDTKTYVDEHSVTDVQVNGTSVVTNGVANVPKGGLNALGAVCYDNQYGNNGITITANGAIRVVAADINNNIKNASNGYRPITATTQHAAAFYGLAKAAGDSTQSASSNAVGNYTDSAKSAIHEMLSGSVSVSGTTPSITALPGIQYVCGECATLDITLPASGCVDVVFQSGSTATVLTVTPPTGVTVKWANGFDPTALDANTTYEINIKDGLGVAAAWT